MIGIVCPKCKVEIDADESYAGQTIECPKCKTHIKVPSPPVPAGSSGGVDLSVLQEIAKATARTAKDVNEIRNLIAVAMVFWVIAFVLFLLG